MGLTAAATLPATFATAVYALRHLGNLRRGERLLVHGAAGALGLAAVQLARAVGAEVYATAGTPEKRELLRELGATRVMDSRSLAFADEIREATGGEGVDVVLNSLAGEALVRGLSVLKPLGRFLEVGKRDFFENGRLGFRLLQQRSFHAIDLDKVIALAPDLTRALLDEVRALAEAGTIAPLPHRVFPLARASEAFATMLRSRHVGKLVIETRDPRVPVREAARPVAVRPDGTYVVTGGLGGFGLAAAEWLARQGAGRVVLVGRRGPTAEQRAKVEALGAWGSEVLVRAADVSDAAAIARILDAIRSGGPPLRGVIHAAMVLDDGMLMNAGRERVARVLAPKVRGAANLDAATRADPLDFFVCCSSVAGLLGNPGQAVYAGANTFLDALCQRRRAEGRPGLSVSLGAIADTGFVARTAGLPEALAARGMVAFEAREALELLGRLLGASRAHVGLFRYDWSRYAGSSALVAELADERRATARAASEAGETDLRARIAAGDGDERRRLLHERLSWHVSRILGVGGAGLDPDRPLVDMGLDSLMSVDLQHFIGASFGAEVPVMSILQGWSIARLAAEIDRRLGGAPESAA
jgi:NADPH:quinone reductase-like Zn-dependent oxidoreductase